MAFFDRFKKVYLVKVRCYNCGHTQDCKVPKGMTIDAHLKTEAAQCENCGNPTLRRIELVRVPPAAQGPVKEYIKRREPELPPLPTRKRVIIPPKMPSRARGPSIPVYRQPPEYYDTSNEVEYPVNEPVPTNEKEEKLGFNQPEWAPKPKKINLWTGRDDIQ